MKSPTSQRFVQLDALRGIAALWVMLFHLTVRFDELYGHPQGLPFYLPDGRHGVHLFFMISGFVILMTLDKTKSILDFAFFRFSRLYPLYWCAAALTFTIVAIAGLPGREVSVKDALINLTMIPEVLGAELIDNCYWSLQVELFFYMLMAFIVAIGFRRYLIAIIALLVFADIGLLLYWDAPAITLPKMVKAVRLLLGLRFLHLFLFGIVCYEMRSVRRWYQPLLLLLCVLAAAVDHPLEHFGIIAGCGALFFWATRWEVPLLQSRWLVFLGVISYPLYLLHQNIGYVVIREAYAYGAPGIVAVGAAIAVGIVLATILSFTVEHPFNQWLRGQYKRWWK